MANYVCYVCKVLEVDRSGLRFLQNSFLVNCIALFTFARMSLMVVVVGLRVRCIC